MRKYLDILEAQTLSEAWTDKVQNVYDSVEELKQYDGIYNIVSRCGFDSAEALWSANPLIKGSTNPSDFGLAKGKKKVSEDAKAASPLNLLSRYVGLVEEGYTAATVNSLKVDEFVRGYIECMLWSENDDQGEPLNKNYTADDISHETMDRIEADCRSFLHRAGPFLTVDRFRGANLTSLEARAGHDFYLTRVGHGSGFWDGDWEGESSAMDGPLSKAAKDAGHVDVMIGDDLKIHMV